MSLENVLAFLEQEKDEHLRQIAIIEKMIAFAANETPQIQPARVEIGSNHLTEEERRRLQREKKRNYKIKPEIRSQVIELAHARREKEGIIKSIPGSFKATQIAEDSGRNISTIRKALSQLEKEGLVTKIEKMPWSQLGDTPQRQTAIYVAGERGGDESVEKKQTPERKWGLRNGESISRVVE